MRIGSIIGVTLAAALAFPAAGQDVEEEEGFPDSVVAALEAARAAQMENRDTCFALTDAYRAAVEKSYPVAPDFKPTACTTGTGLNVVMTCSPSGQWRKRIEGRTPSVVTDTVTGETAEHVCRTVRAP